MKTLLAIIFTAAVLMFTGSSFAQDGHHEHGRHHPHGAPGFPVLDHFRHAMRDLDLSDQQKSDIETVMQGLKDELQPLMNDMRANHEQLRALVTAKTYDKGAVAAVAKKEGELATKRIVLSSEAMSKMLGYLTDDQRAKLDQMHAERMQRWQNRWKDKTPAPDTAD